MCSVPVVAPTFQTSLSEFDLNQEELHKLHQKKEFVAEFSRRDALLCEQFGRVCPSCGGPLYAHGRTQPKRLLITAGNVHVCHQRFRCSGCGHIVVPGKTLLQNDILPSVAERLLDLSARLPFGQVTDVIKVQHGIDIAPSTLWRIIQKEGQAITDEIALQTKELFTHGSAPEPDTVLQGDTLYLGIDGGFVHGSKKSFEVKCGTCFSGVRQISDNRHELTERFGYAANVTGEEFIKRMVTVIYKRGFDHTKRLVVLSDGASWIHKQVAEWMPGAVHVLDLYHLKKHITQVIRTDESLCREILDAADAYDPGEIVRLIGIYKPYNEVNAQRKKDLLRYVINNAQAIRNHHKVAIHGSGCIEKAVDLVISRRFKLRGMSWSKDGVSALLPFRTLLYNKQWDVYWDQRKSDSQHVA